MFTLHHCVGARSFRPLWTLEELGLPYDLIVLDFPPRFRAREFMTVNPLGTVPAFRDGDVFMTESAAICQYLADRHPEGGLAVEAGSPIYGDYLNWLHFGEATLTFPQTLVLRYSRLEPESRRQPQIAEDYTRWFLARLRRLAEVPLERSYLCGERFTAADISVGYALMLASYIGLQERFPESVARYWERLQARGGYQRALAAEIKAAQQKGVSPKFAALAD